MKSITGITLLFFTLKIAAQSTAIGAYTIGETHTIYSDILKEERIFHIHVPKGFWGMDDSMKNYPVTFVLDGESQFLNTVSAIDFLSASALGNDQMPLTIVVGIPNTNRNRDLTPTKGIIGNDSTTLEITGGGPKFLDFITTELVPYLDSLYATSAHRTIVGHSMGGLIVFEALLNKHKFFDNYLAIDPFLSYNNASYFNQVLGTLRNVNLNEEYLFVATANTLPTFVDTLTIEQDTSELLRLTKSGLKFHNIADSENWQVNCASKHFPDENHFSLPYTATYHAMKFFYSYYPFQEMLNYCHPAFATKTDLVIKLEQHYQEISNQLGYTIFPMESYINSWAYGLANYNRSDLSIDLFDYNIKLYPNKASVYNSKGFFLMNSGKKKRAIHLFEKALKIKEEEAIRNILEELKRQ